MSDRSIPMGGSEDDASARLNSYLGGNIRQARARQDMSLMDLGCLLNIQESLLADYESGYKRVSAVMLYRIADTLNVTLASLFGVIKL